MEPASNRPLADVRLLGPVEVIGPGGTALLPGSRQRALVGLLALQPGAIVGQASLIDALWGDEPPRTAVKTLYSHVTRVRQAMEACGLPNLLRTRDPGYVLSITGGEVDAVRFEEQIQRARTATTPGEVAKLLHEALSLWRGDAFADADLAGSAKAAIDRLHEIRIAAAEDLWEAELERGEHSRSASELELLVARHPYRERLVGLLMVARYRGGRHADALEAYHQLRNRLADELGVDPGLQLQRQYAAILRHEEASIGSATAVPAAPRFPRPAELPAPVGHFTGRISELAAMNDVLDPGGAHILAVSGAGGMGKTALALQWAHLMESSFPDGQLFLDLRGHEPGQVMPVTEALPRLLRSLGVPSDRIPAELSEQSGLYRSLLHDKRVLVLLDNCGAVDQLLPLIPGGDSSVLLITSRNRLTALAAYHAVQLVDLDALENDEAFELLRDVVGDRIGHESDDANTLIDLCARMPLALRIAAALLAAHPTQPVAALTADLAGNDRLDALSIEGDSRSVRTVFASAYGGLTAPAARTFRLLGLHPGPTAQLNLAASVTDSSPIEAKSALAELAAAHLIADLGDGHYRFHDLIRLYAAECVQREESAGQRAEALHRMVDWYLAIGEVANRLLNPSHDRVVPTLRYPPSDLPPGVGEHADRDSVLAFLDAERPNLVPITRTATVSGHPEAAWQLTYLLTGFYAFRGHRADRIEICRWAVDAARRTGDEFAEGIMASSLGVAYKAAHQFQQALEPLQRSQFLTSKTGDKRGLGNALNNLANAYVGLRRYDEAVDAFQQALPLYDETGQIGSAAATLNNLGLTCLQREQVELGFEYLAQALAVARGLSDPRLEGAITHTLGEAQLSHGSAVEAVTTLRTALNIRLGAGDRHFAPETLTQLGAAHLACHDVTTAVDVLEQAVTASQGIVDEHLEATALRHLGKAYQQAGDPAAATEQLQRALALRARIPEPVEEALIRQLLDELAQSGS